MEQWRETLIETSPGENGKRRVTVIIRSCLEECYAKGKQSNGALKQKKSIFSVISLFLTDFLFWKFIATLWACNFLQCIRIY